MQQLLARGGAGGVVEWIVDVSVGDFRILATRYLRCIFSFSWSMLLDYALLFLIIRSHVSL